MHRNSEYKLIDQDPSGIFGSLSALVAALLVLLVAFGIDITEEQQAAILSVLAVLGPAVTAILIRFKAYSPATHFEEVKNAVTLSHLPGTPGL